MGHQEAQTLTNTGVPRRSASESAEPSSVSPASSTPSADPEVVGPAGEDRCELLSSPPQPATTVSNTTRSPRRRISGHRTRRSLRRDETWRGSLAVTERAGTMTAGRCEDDDRARTGGPCRGIPRGRGPGANRLGGGGLLGAGFVGMAFAFGWTPWVGPTLSAILTLSAGGGG